MSNRIHSTQRDALTSAPIGITTDHNYIHKGKAFSAMGSASVTSAGTYAITLTTPATKYVHFRPTLFSSSASFMSFALIEAPTFTAGTAGTPINRNRNSTTTAGTLYGFNAGYTSGGTVLDMTTTGTGGNPTARSGGAAGADAEIVFKPSTTYLILCTNPAGGATSTLTWNLFWYEEDEGVI